MFTLFRLRNSLKRYAWGSLTEIPRLLSLSNTDGGPYAELWMGAHPNDPSIAISRESELKLNDLIASDPEAFLGQEISARFGGLPYLFKVLAAAKPLSIQVHPNTRQAIDGWRRENEAGIDINDQKRNFHDKNHKPEILCALTPFKAMCGFRAPHEIFELLDAFDAPILRSLYLKLRDSKKPLEDLVRGLFALSISERALLEAYALRRARYLASDDPGRASIWRIVETLSSLHPGDPAIISPLYLNTLTLEPGQAIFLPAGIFHSYIEGVGVELMANSDNVLRGGLTTKHIDPEELARTLLFEPYRPELLSAVKSVSGPDFFPVDCDEFSLLSVKLYSDTEIIKLPEGRPLIVLVVDGVFRLRNNDGEEIILNKGESAFAAACSPKTTLNGQGSSYIATVGGRA